jgi:ABC-type dipeptide/oligopeptide/nickel transport system ATPase component
MAELIAIVGESGSGKTTSIRNLNPEHTFIISTTGKRPGIKGANKKYPTFNVADGKVSGNFFTTSNVDKIGQMLQIIDKKMPHITTVVIDDYQYVMGFEAMDRAKEKSYDKFTDIAQHAYQVLKTSMNMRDDLNVVVSTHSENTGDRISPYYKMKTLGKMLDSVITLEGLFTYVFFTTVQRDDDGKASYKFITNSDGTCTAKSPMGLFEEIYVDNDLDMILKRIKEYNEED